VTTVFVSLDTTARALGADAVAGAIASHAMCCGATVQVRRTGSRGAVWLEPLVEVDTAAGRVAYGPVQAHDVDSLFAAGFLAAGAHPLALGPTEAIPYFKRQQRLTFARVGVIDPLSLPEYEAHGGLEGLRRALDMSGAAIVEQIVDSGLRGRGGAAFPAGIKWRTVREQDGAHKVVVCNADEGDSGTFADRMLIEGDPFSLIEGMAIAGLAVGAERGYIYLRSEYPQALQILNAALEAMRFARWLGRNVAGKGRRFDLEVRVGAGAYICGEETALLESIEGRRGVTRARPPVPAVAGLFGQPTIVNNVLTLATVPWILAHGAARYRDFGVGRSRGTQPFQLAGNVKRGGLVELAFGTTLRELVEDFGGGTASGRPMRAVQVGGPLGAYLTPAQFDLPLDYEGFAAHGGMLGHGGIVVFDDTVDLAQMARFAFEFCALESCGKCTPCRAGAVRGMELVDAIVAGRERSASMKKLDELCEVMTEGSACGLGAMAPAPVRSALRHFPQDFGLAAAPQPGDHP
jgi:formate dehydrogenase iron-sulfur subunit